MSDKKTYVGKGKIGSYDIVNFSVCLTDLPKDEIFEYQGKKYIKLSIAPMREEDKYGKTHTVWVNDFKPEKQEEKRTYSKNNSEPVEVPAEPEQNDDLPF